jgi:PEP-CTERM motif
MIGAQATPRSYARPGTGRYSPARTRRAGWLHRALGTGSQGSPEGNQLVRITGLGSFTQVEFSSSRNAFEFSLGAPEPSTWAMMLVGFAGLGFLGWRGSRRTAAQAA